MHCSMPRLLFITGVFLLLLGYASKGYAQWKEKTQFFGGGFLEFIPVRDGAGRSVFSAHPLFYGINFGAHYVLAHSNDSYSLCATPNINFAFNYNNLLGASVLFQTPCFLTARIGAQCTPFNTNAVGAAVGIGFNFTYIHLPFMVGNTISSISQPFIAPAAMGELTFSISQQALSLRYHVNLLPFQGKIDDGPSKLPADFSNFGIGLVYFLH